MLIVVEGSVYTVSAVECEDAFVPVCGILPLYVHPVIVAVDEYADVVEILFEP